nr:MAG TPA: hypothetical protein [Caudoviricetes sp.]
MNGARLTGYALTADRCQIASRRAGMVCGVRTLALLYTLL